MKPMISKRTFITCAASCWLFFSGFAFAAESEPVRGEDFIRVPAIGKALSLSNAFQSNMVIQRDKTIALWGWGGAR